MVPAIGEVTRPDRLAPAVIDLHQIIARVTAKGVAFRDLQRAGIDTSTSTGKLTLAVLAAVAEFEADIDTSTAAGIAFLQMLAVFAQFETSIRRERQMDGSAKAKDAGVYKGRKPSVPVEEVRRLKAEGVRPADIARRLKIGRGSVYRALEDPA